MEAAKLCTKEQYIASENKLITWMKQMINFSNSDSTVLVDDGSEKVGNEWDESDDQYDNLATLESTLTSQTEPKKFYEWNTGKTLQEMYDKKQLGVVYDADGKEQNPVFSFREVRLRNKNLPSGKNYSDYILHR